MFDPEEDYTKEILDIPSVYKSHDNDSILIRLKDNKYNKTFILRQSKKYHVTMSEYIQRCIISDFLKQSISNLLDKYDVTI